MSFYTQRCTLPMWAHVHILPFTNKNTVPSLPVWKPCENSHIPGQSLPLIQSICRTPLCHMPASLSQEKIQKSLQTCMSQQIAWNSEAQNDPLTGHKEHISAAAKRIHRWNYHSSLKWSFSSPSNSFSTRAHLPAPIYFTGFPYVPGFSSALRKDIGLFFDSSEVHRDTKAEKCSSGWAHCIIIVRCKHSLRVRLGHASVLSVNRAAVCSPEHQ